MKRTFYNKILGFLFVIMTITNIPSASSFDTIEDRLSYNTVRIKSNFNDGTSGYGTGFFFQFDTDKETTKVSCIITNKHVRYNQKTGEESTNGEIMFHLKDETGKPTGTKGASIQGAMWRWVDHPNNVDLCAMFLNPIAEQMGVSGFPIFTPFLTKDNLITDSDLNRLTPVSSVMMVGYPIGLIDDSRNFPIFRQGITATHPGLSFKGKPEFLIDCACWPGSSGSPVFLRGPSIPLRDKIAANVVFNLAGRPLENKLLGILWGGPHHTAEGAIVAKEIPMVQVPIAQTHVMVNLGFVIHSREILVLRDEILKLLPPNQNEKEEGSLPVKKQRIEEAQSASRSQ